MTRDVKAHSISARARDNCFCTRFSERRSASLESGESVLGIRQRQRLEKYRALWHEDFLGWPLVSSAPVRKDHITDWITANTSKGVRLQSYSIEATRHSCNRDVAINHYRIKATWAANDDSEVRTDVLRITHTWVRAHDTWQILGGMSAPVNDKVVASCSLVAHYCSSGR